MNRCFMMWTSRVVRRYLLLALFSGIVIYFLSDITSIFVSTLSKKTDVRTNRTHNSGAYLVDTPLCKIPKVDPYDPSIRKIVRKTGRRRCSQTSPLTYQVGLELRMNWTAVSEAPYHGNITYCTYTPIHRPKYTPTHNNFLQYLDESESFNDSVTISHDFVKATCYNYDDKNVYVNYHGFIQRNKTADSVYRERFLRYVMKDKVKDRLNVVIIGMDSVSRLSFIRQMVKTRDLLEDELEAFDMTGYNKVADNTFINIVPMTLGKFAAEMPWDESMASVPFDDFNFIWNQFSERGYRTFYAEDAPEIAIFDFLKAGFKTPPADYFNRPMSLAMEMKRELWSNGHHCFLNKLETDIVLDYMFDFLNTFKSEPHFAFTFITRLSHDDVNSAGAADEPYFNFFKRLHDKDLIRNTVVFFFSDHGMRFGDIRSSFIGKLEERLPFMYVVIPKWLKKMYPHLERNLKINEHRLSTPFDVYETLKDILYFNGLQKTNNEHSRGASWFREIPEMRSCDKAGILPHWCTCLHQELLDTAKDVVVEASFVLLSEIKSDLSNYKDICENLSLKDIHQAIRLVESENVLKYVRSVNNVQYVKAVFGDRTKPLEDIQVVIETVPGNAVFEATVRLDTALNTYKVVGDISRINIYGHQSDCIDVFKLKKYCQCKM